MSAVQRAMRDDDGDVLVFLPGHRRDPAHPIGICATSLGAQPRRRASLWPDRCRGPSRMRRSRPSPTGRRRVVLATDIAETRSPSRVCGSWSTAVSLAQPRYDPATGMTRLTTVSTSRDSADQRAGRAGRTEPGVAYRLWSTVEHGTRAAHRPPEISQVDLAGLALEVAAWGASADSAPLPRSPAGASARPGDRAAHRARRARRRGHGSPHVGRRMVGLPLHPRLARMVIADSVVACPASVAALLDERDVLRGRPDELPVDLALRRPDRRRRAPRPRRSARRRPWCAPTPPTSPVGPTCRSTPGCGRRRSLPVRCCSTPIPTGSPAGDDPGSSSCARDRRLHRHRRSARPRAVRRRRRSRRAALPGADPPRRGTHRRRRRRRPRRSPRRDAVALEWDQRSRRPGRPCRAPPRCAPPRRAGAASPSQATRPPPCSLDRVRRTASPCSAGRGARWRCVRASTSSIAWSATRGQIGARTPCSPVVDEWLAPYLAGMTRRGDLERARRRHAVAVTVAVARWRRARRSGTAVTRSAHRRDRCRSTTTASGRRPGCECRTCSGSASTRRSPAGVCPIVLELLSPADRPIQVTVRSARLLVGLVGGGPQGDGRSLSEAPVAARPGHGSTASPQAGSGSRLKITRTVRCHAGTSARRRRAAARCGSSSKMRLKERPIG